MLPRLGSVTSKTLRGASQSLVVSPTFQAQTRTYSLPFFRCVTDLKVRCFRDCSLLSFLTIFLTNPIYGRFVLACAPELASTRADIRPTQHIPLISPAGALWPCKSTMLETVQTSRILRCGISRRGTGPQSACLHYVARLLVRLTLR